MATDDQPADGSEQLPVDPTAEYALAETVLALTLGCEPVGVIAKTLGLDHERVHELLALGMRRGLFRHTAEQALALAEQRALLIVKVGLAGMNHPDRSQAERTPAPGWR